jgi:long-chain fatty acid transport protein
MRLPARVAAAVLGLAVAASRTAHASPEDIFGYGPRSPALGGTGVASSNGFEAAYTNPALLARIRDRKLTLGLQGASFDLHADGPGDPGRISYGAAKGIVIGAELPIPFGGILKDRIAGAFAFYTPTDIIVRGRILYPEVPQYPLLPDRAQSLAVRMGLGADLGKGIRVGLGFAALAEIDGTVLVATDATGRVGSRVEDQLIATYAPIVGASWDLPVDAERSFHVGVTYRGTLDARFAVSIDATKLSTLNIPVFNIAGVAQYDPAQIALEVAHDAGHWLFAAGVTYKRWSQYPGLVEPTILCPSDTPDCGALQPASFNLSDTLVPRAGVERAIPMTKSATAYARGGFFYEPSPVPSSLPASQAWDQTQATTVPVPTRFYDASRFVLTLGGGLDLRSPLPPITLDVYAQYHLLQSRDVATGTGATSSLSGHVLFGGMTAGVRF